MSCRHPSRSSAGGYAEQLLQPLGPDAGKIRRHELAGDHRPLKAIAQNHVSRIRHFVGVDPYQAAPDMDLAPMECFGVPPGPSQANTSRRIGAAKVKKARLRQTCISRSKDWLS